MWKNNMSDVQASMLPPYLKDRRLYDGTMFLNDPDACSPAQAAAAATTGLCNQGKLTGAFAAALCRAEMVENGKVVVTCEFCSSIYEFTPEEAGVD